MSWSEVKPYMKNADLLLTFLWDNKIDRAKLKVRRIAKNTLYIIDKAGISQIILLTGFYY